jgi:hypothetical protein
VLSRSFIALVMLAQAGCLSLPSLLVGGRSSLRTAGSRARVSWQIGAALTFSARDQSTAPPREPEELHASATGQREAPCEVTILCAFEDHERARALRKASVLFEEEAP